MNEATIITSLFIMFNMWLVLCFTFPQTSATSSCGLRTIALAGCLEELPPRSRQAIESTYRHGARRSQLAEALGIGEHGVRTMLQRIRKNLRACIERRLRA